nr:MULTISPECIES: hypothetical protein [unclassified Pseudomonas]
MPQTNPRDLPNLPLQTLVASHECDLLMCREPLEPGEKSCCPRCGFELAVHRHQWQRRCFALLLTQVWLEMSMSPHQVWEALDEDERGTPD